MRWFRILAVVVLLFIAILAGMIAFGTAKAPQRAQSVIDPFRGVDYSDLPAVSRYKARDGSALSYREYRAAIPAGAGETQVAVLVHGSSDSGVGMHAMAKMLAQAGITVFVPELRGHGANQPLATWRTSVNLMMTWLILFNSNGRGIPQPDGR